MRVRTIAFALLLALPAAVAVAQKQSPPPAGPAKDFQLPTPIEFRLDNGLEVTLVPYGTVPKVTVELAVLAGSANEGPKQVWLGNLAGDLMREGTTTRSAMDISQAAARMGGSLDIAFGVNATEIGGDVLSEFGPEMARLVADVAMNPRLPESELARLKADLARELAIARTQPQQMALETFRGLMYPDHPYGRLFPTAEMIETFTLADVRSFYDTNFGASRAHLYVAGRFDQKAMEAAIRAAFGSWKAGKPSTLPAPQPKSARAVHIVDRPGAVQSTILLGMPVPDPSHPDYVPLSLVNTMLGGYFSSRITSNIREAKGYTYSPNSHLSSRYRDAYWAQAADVTTDVTGPSLKEIFYEIDRLQAEPPSAAELKAVQNYMAGIFVLQNSSRAGIVNRLEFVDLHGLPDDYLKTYVRRLYAVTPQDVARIAQKYIQDDRATIVVVGDRKVIEEQVKPYGKVAQLPR
jgi:predicted Zn-dependent peptidase